MSNSIRLSEKHGVNPTMCQCFFCGEVKHIALLGHIGDRRKGEDIEAPMQCVMDYEPCETCQSNMNLGVALLEVVPTQPDDNRPPMKAKGNQDVYPTGRWLVMKEEAVNEMFNVQMSKGDKVFIDTEIMDRLVEVSESCQ